jgi:uncharacterized protein
MKKIMLVGGTGFIGNSLAQALELSGHQIILLSRYQSASSMYPICTWNPSAGEIPAKILKDQDVIINLGGANIAGGRWTVKRKNEILNSRIIGTRLLIKTILKHQLQPQLFINASAIGFYGDRPGEQLTEESEKGTGFLSTVCSAWENELLALTELSVPYAIARFGMVLSNHGGIFPKLMLPLRNGLSICYGGGQQFLSWIHIADLIRSIQALINMQLVPGIYNFTAPAPIRQVEFNKIVHDLTGKKLIQLTLSKKVLSTLLGEFATLITDDLNVIPARLMNQKFEYKFPTLGLTMEKLLKDQK